jgi:RNA-binding protein 26
MKRDPKNCSLELRRIPAKENDIVTLSSHFAKFGKIVNVQVNFNGQPDAALVTFSQPAEATAAFKSPEPVLNNRFIRVFWHDGVSSFIQF